MERFSADAIRLELGASDRGGAGGQVVLWHARTGRHAALSRETFAELEAWTPGMAPAHTLMPALARLDGLHLLGASATPPFPRLIPVASRLVLLLPELPALWLPMPTIRTPGGFAYAEYRLNPAELRLWQAINGARPLREVAARAGLSLEDALPFVFTLTAPEAQALQLRDRPVTRRELSLERLVAPERPPAARPSHLRGSRGETTLSHYHIHEITDADTHFDDRETTVAHAFALPHPALGGQTYGARLFAALDGRGLVPHVARILEIGPGTGELARRWTEASDEQDKASDYLRLDRSPELLAAQGRMAPRTRGIAGNATELPVADASLDLILCNEVIADLEAVPYDPAEPVWPGSPVAELVARLERYKLESLPPGSFYNLGALKLIEELARALAPGGAAFVSEFGAPDEIPTETAQLDHPEVSICFGHLLVAARALGLEATLLPLPELLEMDLSAVWLARHSYEALRARMRSEGRSLEARAWTPETLDLPWPVDGLQWVPVSDPGPGPLPTRFWALLLRR